MRVCEQTTRALCLIGPIKSSGWIFTATFLIISFFFSKILQTQETLLFPQNINQIRASKNKKEKKHIVSRKFRNPLIKRSNRRTIVRLDEINSVFYFMNLFFFLRLILMRLKKISFRETAKPYCVCWLTMGGIRASASCCKVSLRCRQFSVTYPRCDVVMPAPFSPESQAVTSWVTLAAHNFAAARGYFCFS